MERINKIYYSEKSIVLGSLLWGLTLFFLFFGIYNESIIFIGVVSFFIVVFAIQWFGTRYLIIDNKLLVKIGPITHTTIDINTIKSIKNNKGNLMASPANSFNRIAIKYGKYEEILLSPKNRKAFMEDLVKVNAAIKINEDLL